MHLSHWRNSNEIIIHVSKSLYYSLIVDSRCISLQQTWSCALASLQNIWTMKYLKKTQLQLCRDGKMWWSERSLALYTDLYTLIPCRSEQVNVYASHQRITSIYCWPFLHYFCVLHVSIMQIRQGIFIPVKNGP